MVSGKYCLGSGLGGVGVVLGSGNILFLDLDGDSMVIKVYMCTFLHVII